MIIEQLLMVLDAPYISKPEDLRLTVTFSSLSRKLNDE